MYSFKEFMHFLWLQKKVILVMTLCFMGIGCGGMFFMKGFDYTNQVSFLLPATEHGVEDNGDEDRLEIENQVISSNIKLVETYKEMVKSEPMLQAIQKDNPQQSKQALLASMKVSSSINSQIFTVAITTRSPEQSKKIAVSLSEHYPQIVENSRLPRNVFLLSAQSIETERTPSVPKFILGIFIMSFMLSTSCSFGWSYVHERKFLRTPEAAQQLMEIEAIGIVDFYEI
ncbi:YveK family protein [Candidatus Enterococcus murrayae]|uniref:Capsular polysaccharide biosynthesis protein CpsC n=1 Tax=Candidatus Enterococcus murrayae TaxID=2815321 RepID=A0ABS3HE69_9ENTE|nr:hypothetical protein [Enterococcus sp. MJM16]MBO0451200.1 hypothetical protein [Enterococcus sp. MJM16]